MKTKKIFFTVLFIAFSISLISAQEKTELITPKFDQKCNELIIQLNAVVLKESNYAKTQNFTASEYGEYVALQFIKKGLVKEFTYDDFTNACLYPYACLLESSEYEIAEYSTKVTMIKEEKFMPMLASDNYIVEPITDFFKIKSCKPNGLIAGRENSAFTSKQEYMDYFSAAMRTIGKYVGFNYYTREEDELVYTIISKY